MKSVIFNPSPLVHQATTILRVWLGIIFVKHSYPVVLFGGMPEYVNWIDSMGIPLAEIAGRLSKLSEFFGGIFIALGLGTRLFSVLIAINMIIAVTVAGKGQIFTGSELAFDYLLISIVVCLSGSGKFSLDYLIFKNKLA